MLQVNVMELSGFSEAGTVKVGKAMAIMEQVFNHPLFTAAVLNFTHNSKQEFYFRKNIWGTWLDKYHTNQQVLTSIINAEEQTGNTAVGKIDLYLHLDPRKGGGVVGYGYPGQKEIYTYSDWFTSFNPLGYASHIAHEWCHKLGFTHAHKKSKWREYSVPYAIGYLIAGIHEQITVAGT